jgi:hypothetical protein
MVAAKIANMTKSDAGTIGRIKQIGASADLHLPENKISTDQAASMLNIGKRSVQRVTARDGCGENCEFRKRWRRFKSA